MKRRELTKWAVSPNHASPRIGRTIRMKKYSNHTGQFAEFYILSTNQPFVAVRSRRCVLRSAATLRKYSLIITFPCRIGRTLWGWLTKPRIATNGANDSNEKIPEPYRTIRIILHFFPLISHSWRFGAGDTYLPTGIRTAAVPYESTPASLHIITYPCRMGQSLE